jgi:hypothetical protein
MNPKILRCTCTNTHKPTSNATTKAKSLLKSLLPSKTRANPSKAQTLCRACKTATHRQGMVFTKPLRFHVPSKFYTPPTDEGSRSRDEINRYIWGETAGSVDEDGVIANRVYAMLRLENSPVLEYFEQKKEGCDLADLPQDLKRSLERVIGAQF